MDRIKHIWQKTNRWHRVLLVFVLVELRFIPKRQLGFECNDPALSHAFTGDTISWKWLLASVILLPLVVLLTTERVYGDDKRSKQLALFWYEEYLYGMLLNLTIVATLKILVGAPRPHFFDSCSPKEASTCTGAEYVHSYTCTKGHWMNHPDTSFPSGHTSLGVHTGFFIAYYLHRRTKHLYSKRVYAVQVLFVVAAIFCGLSRITDRRHHWWDVLAGAVIGIPILIYTTHSLCKNFDCQIKKKRKENNDVQSSNGLTQQSQQS